MPYQTDTNTLKASAAGQTMETNPGEYRPAGLYRHPLSGKEMVVMDDPLYGDAQAAGATRVGFVYVGPAPEGYVKDLPIASLQAEKQREDVNDNSDALKGLLARVNQLEAEKAKRDEEDAKRGEAREQEAILGTEQTKEEAMKNQFSREGLEQAEAAQKAKDAVSGETTDVKTSDKTPATDAKADSNDKNDKKEGKK